MYTYVEDDARMEVLRLREEKQPLDLPSAGSTFKRPEGHFAGKLIMDAGLQGYQVGGAAVAERDVRLPVLGVAGSLGRDGLRPARTCCFASCSHDPILGRGGDGAGDGWSGWEASPLVPALMRAPDGAG